MQLAAAVRRGPTMLLPAGKALAASDIASLVKRYPEHRIRVADPVLDDLVPFEDDSADQALCHQGLEKSSEVMARVMKAQAMPPRQREAHYSLIERKVEEVIAFLTSNPVGRVIPPVPYAPDAYLSDHMANVFHLAMTLGAKLHHYVVSERRRLTYCRDLSMTLAQSLMPLGIGAMYMDLGMAELADLEQKDDPLTPADWKRIREHPRRGARMLPERMPPAARMVVITHHQAIDGSGYPTVRRPDRLHVFTRIIHLCDAFDAATTPRPWRPEPKSHIRMLWEVSRGPDRGQFDPVLVRGLLELIQPLPIGTRVTLSNGRRGVVTGRSRDPFSPTVAIAFDAEGRVLPREQIEGPIQLDPETSDLRVVEANGEDLAYLHDDEAAGLRAAG